MRIKRSGVLAILLTASLCLGLMPLAVGAETSSKEIQGQLDELKKKNAVIQSQINAVQRQYDANFADMESLVEQKNAIDQEIALISNKVETTNEQIEVYSQLIADTQEQLDISKRELKDLSDQHSARVRAMEEQGKLTYWQVIFEANSFTDLLDRIDMMEEIDASDRRRIEQMRIVSDIVTATQTNLEQEKSELEEITQGLVEDQALLEERRSESDGLLYELEKKAEEYEILIAESEVLQNDLMVEIAAKEKELKQAKYNEELARLALQGENPPSDATWITPVSGFLLTSPFGNRLHPILKRNIMHNGVDMACDTGTPIYATRAGVVTTTSYQAGGAGNYVSINHLDGFASIYMHMTHYVVSPGQNVSQGQLIGYVGSTGLSTGPHLHFGVSYAGTYVNPLAYIYG